MLAVGLAQRKKGGLAAQNGVNAANWALILIATPVLFFATMITGLLTGETTDTGIRMHSGMEAALVVIGILYGLLMVGHLVVTVLGIVKARGGQVLRAPAPPVFKAPQQ